MVAPTVERRPILTAERQIWADTRVCPYRNRVIVWKVSISMRISSGSPIPFVSS